MQKPYELTSLPWIGLLLGMVYGGLLGMGIGEFFSGPRSAWPALGVAIGAIPGGIVGFIVTEVAEQEGGLFRDIVASILGMLVGIPVGMMMAYGVSYIFTPVASASSHWNVIPGIAGGIFGAVVGAVGVWLTPEIRYNKNGGYLLVPTLVGILGGSFVGLISAGMSGSSAGSILKEALGIAVLGGVAGFIPGTILLIFLNIFGIWGRGERL